MPSSGYPSVDLDAGPDAYRMVREEMLAAIANGLEIEWLEAFIGAWEVTKDVYISAAAGGQEWDF